MSQTPIEQAHIASAVSFELAKVERPDIRTRVVSHLLNIHEDLANAVADKLGLADLPEPADAAVRCREDLDPSPALSILENGPDRFEGRKLGILLSDGADSKLLAALQKAIEKAGGTVEIVAPRIGGATLDDGTIIEAKQAIEGGPSVLYDAVAILVSPDGAEELATKPAARQFVADAFAHCKFIAHNADAAPLLAKGGIDAPDDGVIELSTAKTIAEFVEALGELRYWEREPA
jgi:catalase